MSNLNMITPLTVQGIINKFCYTIGMLPTSYKQSLTYEEQLLAIGHYLETTVYPAINNNAQALAELQTLFAALQNYVNNYFDNLDLTQEISDKLDEMAENGTLGDLIDQYITNNIIRIYQTNNDLISADLTEGITAKTLGYTTKGDYGGAYYYITENEPANTEHYLTLNNNNFALLINEGFATPEMFGAIGDGLTNDLTALNNCRDYCINHNILMKSASNKIYGLNDGFSLLTGCNYDFNNATFKALTTMTYVIRQHKEIDTFNIPVNSEYTKNIVIDCDNKADYGFYQDNLGWSALTENIRVINPKAIGIYIKTGQIRLHNAKVEEELDLDRIGLQVDSTDSEYYNIVIRDCKTGIKITGSSNGFYECHPVMFKTGLLPNSIGFDISAWNVFVHPIADTFQYSFYLRHFGGADIYSPQMVINTTYYNNETMETNPTFFYVTNGNNGVNRLNIHGSQMPDGNIINSQKAIFTNVTKWNSGELYLNNPSINFANVQGKPKQVMQYNATTDLSSYIQSGYTAVNMFANKNGNMLEYRLTKIDLPAINQNTTANITLNMPTDLVPDYTRYTNIVTANGVACILGFNNAGAIQILPISNAITQGDYFYYTGVILK